MEKKDIILIVAIAIGIGFTLYKKYLKKDHGKTGNGPAPKSGSSFSSPSKDDDYEPYSKK
jgi:hypothetical protein